MGISVKKRQQLKAEAHVLKPVILMGQHGLTPAVEEEIEYALTAHELIKIRLSAEDKIERERLIEKICGPRKAEFVQLIGKILIIYRKKTENN